MRLQQQFLVDSPASPAFGITSMAISFPDENEYNDKVLPIRLKLDVYYVKHASFFGDIRLIWWTVLAILYTACVNTLNGCMISWLNTLKPYNTKYKKTMKYLLVVAHPDDETLGAGASMWKWSHQGNTVDVCIMCTEAKARAFRPSDEELGDDTNESNKFLGVNKIYEGTFPNIEMNTVPHLKLVQFIEAAIKESEPDIIITHHPADTNNDHLQASMACQEAIRLFQRRPEVKRVKEFWYMEVPSCSEWKINNAMNSFNPNCYVETEKMALKLRLRHFQCIVA